MSFLRMRRYRRAAILMVPGVVVAQEVIHPHREILVSNPHPAHILQYAAFDRLSYLLSLGIRARRHPVQPYNVDETLIESVVCWRCRCVVDDRLQRYGVHLHTVPVALGKGGPGALILLWCSGGPLLEMLADNGCAGAVENGLVLEDGHAEAVHHI